MKSEIEKMVKRINSSNEARRILKENIFDQKVVIGTNEGESFTLEITHQNPTLRVKRGSVPFHMFRTVEIRMDKGLLISILNGEESYSKHFVDGKVKAKGLLHVLMLMGRLFRINGDLARSHSIP
ncbi:MAG: hypothetical protein ABH852_00305 [Methanobacteriota archaeon]